MQNYRPWPAFLHVRLFRHEPCAPCDTNAGTIDPVLASLVALIAPPRCAACTAPTAAGRTLCRACTTQLPWLTDPCPRCALPQPCGPPCPAARAAFTTAWAPLAYDGPARGLIHALKFHGRTATAHTMAAHIAANIPRPLLLDAAVLVPAPTHPTRKRTRGFDQAHLLACALTKRTNIPLLAALSRHGAATRQLGAGRFARRSAEMDIEPSRAIHGTAILIDDVHTTGATLDACARALRAAGAQDVRAVTYARTLG